MMKSKSLIIDQQTRKFYKRFDFSKAKQYMVETLQSTEELSKSVSNINE